MGRKVAKHELSEYKLILRVDASSRLNDEQKSALKHRLRDFIDTMEDLDEWPEMPELNLVSSKILFIDDEKPANPRSQ